jgi:DNA-directed RNA polymerase specialized sigma24 family protein
MVQDALEVPLSRADWYDPERGTLPAALRSVITHRFIDHCRAGARRKRLAVHHTEGLEGHSPTRQMADRTAFLNRQRFLNQLDEEERLLFAMWMRQNQGEVKGPQAADALGMDYGSYEAAKKRLRRKALLVLEELGLTIDDLWGGER